MIEWAKILKANPYHDEKGRFSTQDRASGTATISDSNGWVTVTLSSGEKKLGELQLSTKDGNLQVREANVAEDERGKGYGKVLYKKAIAYAQEKGLGFTSDTATSVSADRVWQSLKKEGYPVERRPVELDPSLNKYYSVKEMKIGDVTLNIRDGQPPWRLLDKVEEASD